MKFVRVLEPGRLVTDSFGILESALYSLSCSMLMVNVAFIAGSSKQGKALRASVGWKSVTPNTLNTKKVLNQNQREVVTRRD